MATAVAVLKFAQFLFWCVTLIPLQFLILTVTTGPAAYVLPRFFHRRICRAFGIKVERVNSPVMDRQTLFVSNHLSYLDISAVTTVLPCSFVAKADIESWPLFGLLAKLQRTAFISRSRSRVGEESGALQARLEKGESLIVFPEGTSSDGTQVLPFKSSLFSLAFQAGEALTVQPFTIELVEIDGRAPLTQADRDLYAWHGDMTLMPHFWAFAKSRGAKVKLHFHAPITIKESGNRKELAKLCESAVAAPLNVISRAAA